MEAARAAVAWPAPAAAVVEVDVGVAVAAAWGTAAALAAVADPVGSSGAGARTCGRRAGAEGVRPDRG